MTIASRAGFLGLACPQEGLVYLARTENGARISAEQYGMSVGKPTGRMRLTFRAD